MIADLLRLQKSAAVLRAASRQKEAGIGNLLAKAGGGLLSGAGRLAVDAGKFVGKNPITAPLGAVGLYSGTQAARAKKNNTMAGFQSMAEPTDRGGPREIT